MIDISPESQGFITELVTSGRFPSREAALEEAVRRLREEFESNRHDDAVVLSAQDWCDLFERWAASHRTLRYEADDSRDAIYAGRGE
jgi:Arc/MetJ-type ribon-helix-helix transcriptional regulator